MKPGDYPTEEIERPISQIERYVEVVFRRLKIVTPDGANCIQAAEMRYRVSVHSISGTHVDWPRELLDVPQGFDPIRAGFTDTRRGPVYVYDRETMMFVPTGNMLVVARCPTCEDERAMCIDGRMYIDSVKGHRVVLVQREPDGPTIS